MSTYSIRRPSSHTIDPATPLNHDPALLDADRLPAGYKRYILRARVGTGAEWYERARVALLNRVMFDLPWISVEGPPPPYATGQHLMVLSRVWPLWTSSPVRILDVVEGDLTSSVTVGALAGHPLQGVERFSVTRDLETGAVMFEIDAVSKPVSFAAATRPLVRLLQRRFRTGAADAMAAASRPPRSTG